MTPYRAVTKQVLAVLHRYGPVQKLGLDEAFVDVTDEVERRLAALLAQGTMVELPIHQGNHQDNNFPAALLTTTTAATAAGQGGLCWHGHVHVAGATRLRQDSRHRVMDLRAEPFSLLYEADGAETHNALNEFHLQNPQQQSKYKYKLGDADWVPRLMLGSALASEIRAAVKSETGLRTSAGIACNKLLAKLVSGLHKPDDQTVLPPPEAAAFLEPLPLRAIAGIGSSFCCFIFS